LGLAIPEAMQQALDEGKSLDLKQLMPDLSPDQLSAFEKQIVAQGGTKVVGSAMVNAVQQAIGARQTLESSLGADGLTKE